MRWFFALSLVGLLACWTTSASAQELVVNGGFEAGTTLPPTGWTQTGNTGFTSIQANASLAHSGNNYFNTGPTITLGGITQTVPSIAGASYFLNFWLVNDGGTPNEFQALWEGNIVLDLLNHPVDAGYIHYIIPVTATANGSAVTFLFRQDPSFWRFDDASVVGVPEPATWGLIGFSAATIIGAFWWHRKRQVRQAELALSKIRH
jgi:hypothetical protein